MAPQAHRSRIHLLAAKEAPIVVILQRKRAKLFHIITVDIEKHSVNEGSWFRGKISAMDSDVSFDGKFMVYLARGRSGDTWSGVCRLPWLKTLVHVETPLTGGGYFSGPQELKTRGWDHSEKIFSSDDIQFMIERDPKRHFGSESAVIFARFERDGFERLGDNWGVMSGSSRLRASTSCAPATMAGAAGLRADILSFRCATWAISVDCGLPLRSRSIRRSSRARAG